MGVLPTGKRIALPAGYPEARPFFKIPGAMREGVFFLRTFGAKALWQKIRKH